mmetsp:Transcript_64359/g.170477  ORF Transcript_64359/g.170477 Transcript_64359/m.170477 type:complete len:108 (+) Transcript_64359:231-554(+)
MRLVPKSSHLHARLTKSSAASEKKKGVAQHRAFLALQGAGVHIAVQLGPESDTLLHKFRVVKRSRWQDSRELARPRELGHASVRRIRNWARARSNCASCTAMTLWPC